METLWLDVKHGIRSLIKRPAFALAAAATLALGIGANTAIFTVVYATLLRPLPFTEPQQLVRITADLTTRGAADVGMSPAELFDYQRRTDLFSSVAGLFPVNANLTGVDQPERVEVMLAGEQYFTLLGVQAQLGRVFTAQDYSPGNADVVVLSDAVWRRRFGADPGVIGRKLRIDNDLYTVIGVLPPGFRHPGFSLQGEVDMWGPSGYRATPFSEQIPRSNYMLNGALARLRPGVSLAVAQAQLDAMAADWRQRYANDYQAKAALGWRPRVVPLQEDLVGRVRPALSILMGAVGLVLLIACANVANLVLTRALERQPEIALRQALGAGRIRLLRQMLTESSLLALAGGALGLLLAVWGLDGLLALVPQRLPRLSEVRIDTAVLAFTALVSLATTLLVGLLPALRACRLNVYDTLREGGKSGGSTARNQLRGVLLGTEVALALVLLTGAGLLIRSFLRLQTVEPGFDADHLLTLRVWLPQPNDPASGPYYEHEKRLAFYHAVLERLRALPGVESAAATTNIPLTGYNAPVALEAEGLDTQPGQATTYAHYGVASPGYFETMRIPLRRGRTFNTFDTASGEPVAMVSEAAAASLWKGEDPVGKRVRFSPRVPWLRVVGVVGDVHIKGLEAASPPLFYRCLEQVSSLSTGFVVRTAGSPQALAELANAQVHAVDPEVPVYALRSMEQVVAGGMAQRRFVMLLLGVFASAAVLLAMVGIYAVVAYSISQRTREIGIRIALGAQRGDLLRMSIGDAARPVAFGLAGGTLIAFGLARFLQSVLFGIGPADAVTYLLVAVGMAAVALLAAYVPARRATRIDPMVALRYE